MERLLRRHRLFEWRSSPYEFRCCHLDYEVRLQFRPEILLSHCYSGYDAPFHLSEECSNANIASPRAIVLTSGIGGIFGWALQMVVAYTVVDIGGVLGSDLGQPWAAYLIQVMPQKITMAILALTIICAFSMGQGNMVSFALGRVLKSLSPNSSYPLGRSITRYLCLCP